MLLSERLAIESVRTAIEKLRGALKVIMLGKNRRM